MSEAIRLDEPESWPHELRELVRGAVEDLGHGRSGTPDLELPSDSSEAIESVLSKRGIVAYQCARLLGSEVDAIKTDGLRGASASLIADKVDAAVRDGFLNWYQAQRIVETGVLADADQRSARTNVVCALTIIRTMEVNWDGVEPLLRNWGGEIGYFWQQHMDTDLEAVLQTIGTPAIIEFMHKPSAENRYLPALHKVVAGSFMKLDDCAGEVHIRVPEGKRLPVRDVWLPGDRE